MAREQRRDVDYFPHECNHGKKMGVIEQRFGNDGYALWFKLLEQLGKANNHYIILDEYTLLHLTSVFRLSEEKTIEILSMLAKLNAIDKYLYENHNVIWSEKFVKSVKEAYRQRATLPFQYSDVLTVLGAKNTQSSDGLTPADGKPAGSIPKEKKRKEEKRKEDNSVESRKLKFAHTLEPFLEEYGREMLNDFYSYWTELTPDKKKFRQETQETWDIARRLKKWKEYEPKFKKEKSSAQKEKEPAVIGRQSAETAQNNFQKFLSNGG